MLDERDKNINIAPLELVVERESASNRYFLPHSTFGSRLGVASGMLQNAVDDENEPPVSF